MTGAEIATLGWLADLLRALLTGAVGDRLKPKSSSERAKRAVINLYQALDKLADTSRDFVLSLNTMARGEILAQDPLRYTMRSVASAVEELRWALRQIDPQLTIHEPAIAATIVDARRSRTIVTSEALLALERFQQSGSIDSFKEVAQQAEKALLEIEDATEQFRKFISEQFSFKESF